jgi:hypothetical protein
MVDLMPRILVVALVVSAAFTAFAHAQEPPPQPPPQPPPVTVEPAPTPDAVVPSSTDEPEGPAAETKRRGLFRLGPVWVSPVFRVGTIGLDTNVLYMRNDRRTDIMGSGGPGLNLVLPFGHATELVSETQVNYTHFVRTASQRHLGGGETVRLARTTPRSTFTLQESFIRTYDRPSYEVDRRIVLDREQTALDLSQRLFGRTRLLAGAARSRTQLPRTEQFLGVDLGRTLQSDDWLVRGGLGYALTPKTSFIVDGTHTTTNFPSDNTRDGVSRELRGGLRTDSTALISGQLLLGVGFFNLAARPAERTRYNVADVEATWHVSPRTSLGVQYTDRLQYSALVLAGAPTLRTETVGVRVVKELLWRLDLRLEGIYNRFRNTSDIALTTADGPVAGRRKDTVRSGSADLGYVFRSRLRVGVKASYTERDSSLDYFGVQGLVVGGTVTYEPSLSFGR